MPRGCGAPVLLRLLRAGATTNCAAAAAAVRIHPLAIKSGHAASDARVVTALADAYAKAGLVVHARKLFDQTPLPLRDLVLCNVMLSSYSRHGLVHQSWSLFSLIRTTTHGFSADAFTFAALLRARATSSSSFPGTLAHGLALRLGLHLHVLVATALLDMYARCGQLTDARCVFDAMVRRNVVSWNAIIVSYARHPHPGGGGKEPIQLFVSMLTCPCRCRPDELTLASLLSSCANMAAAYEATQLHAYALKAGLHQFRQVANALIVAYGKNGLLRDATWAFATIPKPDIVACSSMLSSYAYLGLANTAIHLFDTMLQQGIQPDAIAFLGVLSACTHAGLIQDGLYYFLLMRRRYRIDPTPHHFACLVDLLGRAGRIKDAYSVLVANTSCQTNPDVIGAFLAACKMRGHIELAKWAADKLLSMEQNEPVNYLLISNAYAAAGSWSDLAKVRSAMRTMCGNKVPGCSWIEIGGMVQTFVSNDMLLHQSTEMQQMMQLLVSLVKKESDEDTFCEDPTSI